MKKQINEVKAFWNKNKKKVYICVGSGVAIYVVGKLIKISYEVGYDIGVNDTLNVLKEKVPDAYTAFMKFCTENYPDKFITTKV